MDEAHLETERELALLEKELTRIYARAIKNTKTKIFDKYKQLEKGDTKAVREEIKRLEEILKRTAIEGSRVNKIAIDIMQVELGKVLEINDKWVYSQVVRVMEAKGMDTTFNLLNPRVIKEIMRGDSFKELAIEHLVDKKRIYRNLRRALAQSLILGESNAKAAKRIQAVIGSDYNDAIRIARTETTKVQNKARDEAFKEGINLGIKVKKKWVSASDKRVRDTHKAVNGEVVPYDKKFSNGCDFPGDGPAGEVVNCRCTFVAIMEDYE